MWEFVREPTGQCLPYLSPLCMTATETDSIGLAACSHYWPFPVPKSHEQFFLLYFIHIGLLPL